MDVFLAAILSFPAVVFTALLGVVVVYWLLVVLGALDLDLLGGKAEGAVKGITEGVLEGATKGVAEGVLEGATKGVAEGALEGATKGVAEGAAGSDGHVEGGGASGLLSALRLRSAPVTVVASLVVFHGWLLSTLGSVYAQPPLATFLGGIGASAALLVLATLLAIGATSIAVRPLERFFVTHAAPQHGQLTGKVAVVTTGRVDAKFGQASLEDGGAGLLLQVRCDHPNELSRGKKALLVSWEAEREAFVVEPYEDIVPHPDGGAAQSDSQRRT
ncbi:MAG: glycine zipper family protein [Deltaproteobacteria bacterium]|nr:glycine zipper family protein [Deltaproteobacteria bacterium]